jgi:hypothetical protein
MSSRSVGFDRGICSGLFMEEKMSGQGEVQEFQTNLWVESITPRTIMQGLTTEHLDYLCKGMANSLTISTFSTLHFMR